MVSSAKQRITRRNHYLPARYQLGFAGVNENVWVYDRETDKYRAGPPKSIGFINDFYTTKTADGTREDEVEKCLAVVENAAWPIIDRLDSREERLTRDDRVNLALFASLLRTRVPAFDKEQNNFTDDFFHWWAKLKTPTPEAFRVSALEAGESVSKEEAIEAHRLIHGDDYVVENPRQNNIKLMLSLAVDLTQALLELQWGVLWSGKDHAFITSDNPFLVIPPPNHDFSSGVGVLTPGAVTAIPVSAKTLLFLRSGPDLREPQYGQAPKELTRQINMQVAANSDRFILARDEAYLRRLVRRIKASEWRNTFRLPIYGPSPQGTNR